ncbi:hypothetical protein M0R45_026155 [Rubus argutus]|uniref:DUF4283 domain-containing protein n=1 Tax=Rubus argutus TaxID=59490 RepID=A0AAW1WW75_RUBAR
MVSESHTPRVFRVEFKTFVIQVDDLSSGEAILITEKKREKNYRLSIGLGCVSWLIDQLRDFLKGKRQSSFRKFTGSVGGLIKTIILPLGRDAVGWRLMEANLSAIVYGVPKNSLGRDPLNNKRFQIESKVVESILTYKEALQKQPVKNVLPQNKLLQVSSKKDENSIWQCSVVCKRKSIKSSWIETSKAISDILDKEVILYPFQCNKALLFCSNVEEAEWVARHKKITVNIKDEVSLCRWKQKCNSHGKRKFVSFGGWIEIEGLPFNLWTKETFQQIGDACGGYLETDYRTENFLSLFVARIKVKNNTCGLIPEFVDVIGNFEAFNVRINPVSLSSRKIAADDRKQMSTRIEKKSDVVFPRSSSGGFQISKKTTVENQKAVSGASGSGKPPSELRHAKGSIADGSCLQESRTEVAHLLAKKFNIDGLNDKVAITKPMGNQKVAETKHCGGGAAWQVGEYSGTKANLFFNTAPTCETVNRFKSLSPADFGGMQNPQTVANYRIANKSVLNCEDVWEEDKVVEETLVEDKSERYKGGDFSSEDFKNVESSFLIDELRDEYKELAVKGLNADLLEDSSLGMENLVDLAGILNDDSQVSSDSDEDDPVSSSEEEEDVCVLDSHEGILCDLFKDEDIQPELNSKGDRTEVAISESGKIMKKVKTRTASLHKRPTKTASNSASTSEGKTAERLEGHKE